MKNLNVLQNIQNKCANFKMYHSFFHFGNITCALYVPNCGLNKTELWY